MDITLGHRGIPLMPSVAKKIVVELLKSEKPHWRRKDLVPEVERIHKSRGGIIGIQSTLSVIKKALTYLSEEGVVEGIAFGTWRLKSQSNDFDGIELTDDMKQDIASDIPVEKIIGDGPESVYVYFNKSERKLATIEHRSAWPCKIGRTDGNVIDRIFDQGIKTSFSSYPVVGLVIKSEDSKILERLLHLSLRFSELEPMDSPGSEWFLTSPEIICNWYDSFVSCMELLRPKDAQETVL